MNQRQCPNCESDFSFQNPPKKLKNCQHNLCDKCLPITPKCPIDGKKIDFRRYTHKAFPINHDVLDMLDSNRSKNSSSSLSSPGTKKQQQICLLHSKPIDLVCCDDGSLICANCALFGEHKGHNIKNYSGFMNELTNLTQQVLSVFDQMKQKQQNLNIAIITEYLTDSFKDKRATQLKNIKNSFNKLVQKIRKVQKIAITNLDSALKTKKEELIKEISIQELQAKKNEWYSEVQKLGNVTEEVYQFKSIKEGIKYLKDNSSEGYIGKKGQYLQVQYESAENSIKGKIDEEIKNLKPEFDELTEKSIQDYCSFGKKYSQNKTPIIEKSKNSSKEDEKVNEEDILLEGDSSLIDQYKEQKVYFHQQENMEPSKLTIKIPEVSITKSVQPIPTPKVNKSTINSFQNKLQNNLRSKSRRRKNVSTVDDTSRDILGSVNQNKKKKKIQVPQKYRNVFEDLKNDRSETIDFGGAQLGDSVILSMCQYIGKTNKLRNLKLIRNKLSDDTVYELLNACFKCKITSLNLSQNYLTQKSFELFEKYDLGEVRNITLSLNKINRRNVKDRLDDFVRRGITMSI